MKRGIKDKNIVVLAGPTAGGKTAVTMEIARLTGGEVVSADSRQIYRYLSVGTAKPTPQERRRVPHHMIDFLDPINRFSAGEFSDKALDIVKKLQKKKKFIIIAGGTGLYIKALVDGLSPIPKISASVKKRLTREMMDKGIGFTYKKLLKADPETAAKIHPSHSSRILRAVEVFEGTGKPISYWHGIKPDKPINCLSFGLLWNRKELIERIEKRAILMLKHGMIDEAKTLISKGYPVDCPGLNALGYKEVIDHIMGRISKEDMLHSIIRHTKAYAKRQMTWFRKDKRIQWIRMDKNTLPAKTAAKILSLI